jgi:hypothetical protein
MRVQITAERFRERVEVRLHKKDFLSGKRFLSVTNPTKSSGI